MGEPLTKLETMAVRAEVALIRAVRAERRADVWQRRAQNFEDALERIANGEGYYGAQAREYKEIARTALGTKTDTSDNRCGPNQ